MGKLWIPGGGSGAGSGSDECTASKSEVLKGYSAVTSDSDDEPVQGTLELTADASDGQVLSGKTYYNTDPKKKRTGSMANQGAVSVKLNAGEGYTIPSGFHNGGGKVEANGLASQTPGNATAAHILSGQTAWVNGNKVNGGIPWQNAEISGTDRAWAQGMSNWAGTINLKVRNGHYLNGVNWIQQDIPNYRPENIKKGVNIGGVVGTWEGYVASEQDLYNRGAWGIINSGHLLQSYLSGYSGSIRYDSSQIAFIPTGRDLQLYLLINYKFDVTRYSKVSVTYSSSLSDLAGAVFSFRCGTGYTNNPDANGAGRFTYDVTGSLVGSQTKFSARFTEVTCTLDLTNINTGVYFVIHSYVPAAYEKDGLYIKRIWFS
jgi:hypothetical protein